jgi:hypothetical protein
MAVVDATLFVVVATTGRVLRSNNENNNMVHVHQSYEDFHLDALIQYDLTDDEDCGPSKNDLDSLTSDGLDEVAFNELYESTPCKICDVDEPARSSIREMKKQLVSPNRKVLQQNRRKVVDEGKTGGGGGATMRRLSIGGKRSVIRRRHSMGSRPDEQNKTFIPSDSPFRSIYQMFQRPTVRVSNPKEDRGRVERGKSTRTQEMTVFDESITDDAPEINIQTRVNESLSSICHLADSDLSEVLADQCFDVLNDSISTITSDHCDNHLYDLESTINHPKHNRSVQIIDTKSMESLGVIKESSRRKPLRQSMSHYPYMKIDL